MGLHWHLVVPGESGPFLRPLEGQVPRCQGADLEALEGLS